MFLSPHFQQKLIAKGLKYDKETSKLISGGNRYFTGTFAGYESLIIVYYDTKDNKVYRAKAAIEHESMESAEQVFYDISNMLLEKYPDGIPENIDVENKSVSLSIDLGRIDCYIFKQDGDWTNSYKDRHSVHVDYWDSKAMDQHKSNRMDDL